MIANRQNAIIDATESGDIGDDGYGDRRNHLPWVLHFWIDVRGLNIMAGIEKVSRYIPCNTPSRSHEGLTVRHMLMSIPRVKWLEQDLESCQYYRNYKKYEEVRSPVEPRSVAARVERLLGQELTDREKKIDEMRHTMSSRMIATALNMHSSTVRDDIAKIRAKKGQL
jgi:hypothetical protein